jgi:two-component system, cell cycle response regulator
MSASETTQLLALPARPAVLLVDDDETSRELLMDLMGQEGFSARACDSAEAALVLFEEAFFPIVITDWLMPGMGGLKLCAELRSRALPSYVYVVVLTGFDQAHGAVQALQAGADDYLCKSASPAELQARLRVAERIVTLEQRLRRTLETKARQAASDGLTGLANRRAFDRQFNSDFKRARRFREDLSILLIDVDHFKQVNDRYGHMIGDQVLQQLAIRLRGGLPRDFDFLGRLGGEEFVVLLPHTERAGAALVGERLRDAVASQPISTSAAELQITVSIGVSSLLTNSVREQPTPEDLMDEADRCLYEAKRQGRNRVVSQPPVAPRSLAELYQ